MKNYQTRSERHIRQQKAVMPRPSKRAVVSFIGAGLALSPAVVTLLPEQVQASEYQATSQRIASFIEQIGWSAQDVAANNDLYASVMIAQAIIGKWLWLIYIIQCALLQSFWGQRII